MTDSLHLLRGLSGNSGLSHQIAEGGRGPAPLPDAYAIWNVAMATWTNKNARERLETESGRYPLLVHCLADTLRANIASGRYETAREYRRGGTDEGRDLMRYAHQILVILESELELVEALKAGDRVRWTIVLKCLEVRAERWFGRHSFAMTHDPAEVAGHTCMDLWTALQQRPYPFDVSFDHWAARALLNRMRQAVRDSRIRDRYIADSLDRATGAEPTDLRVDEITAEQNSLGWLDRIADRDLLREALAGIEPLQAKILVLLYLEEMPVKEVAARLGLQPNYVYQLRSRSLAALRESWAALS